MTERRLRVLLMAPCADGTDVGEAWSSYQWAKRLSERHDVTLLTYRKRSRPSAVEQLPGARVVEWTDWPLVGRAERFNSMAKPGYIGYYRSARRWIREQLAAGAHFDVAHQAAPLALRYPSPAAGLPVPLIMGPVAGSLETPEAFRGEMGRTAWYTHLRAIDPFRLRRDPMLRRTYTGAAVVLAVAPYVEALFAGVPIQRFEYMSETGVEELPPPAGGHSTEGPCRLLFVGRIVRMKGVRDAIRAIHQLPPACNVRFDIVGDG